MTIVAYGLGLEPPNIINVGGGILIDVVSENISVRVDYKVIMVNIIDDDINLNTTSDNNTADIHDDGINVDV